MLTCFAPRDAMVAAEAFMPTKCTDTSPCRLKAEEMESAVASEPPVLSISTFTGLPGSASMYHIIAVEVVTSDKAFQM